MRTFIVAAGLAAGVSAAALPRQDQCCFSLTASGGQSGQVGQLGDGQNRVGGGHPAGQYCLSGSSITDGSGRGCILTPPTTQLQCDEGATPDSGFSVSASGELQHNGDSTFYACAAAEGEYNIYTETSDAQTQCSQIKLSTGGQCGGSGNGGGAGGGGPPSAPGSPESSAASPPGGYGSPSTQPAGSVPASSPTAPEGTQPAGPEGTQPAGSEAPPAEYTPPASSPAGPEGTQPAGSVPGAPEGTQPAGTPPTGYPPGSSPAGPEGTQPAGSVPGAPEGTQPASSVPGSSPAGPEGTQPAGSVPGVSAPPQTGGIQTITTTVCGCSEGATPGAPAPSAPAGAPSVPGNSAPVPSAPAPSAPGSPESIPGNSAPAPSAPAPSAPVPSAPGSPESVPGYSAPVPSAPGNTGPAPSAPVPSAPGSPEESVPGQSPSAPAPSAPGSPAESAPGNSAPAPSQPAPSPSGPGAGGYPSQPATGTQPSGSSGGGGSGSGSGSSCQTSLTPGAYETPHLIVPINSASPGQSYGTTYNAHASSANSTVFNFDVPASAAGKTCSLVFLFPRKEDLETTDYTFNGQGSLDFARLSQPVDEGTSYSTCPSTERELGSVTPRPGGSYVVQSGECQAGSTQTVRMSGSGGLEMEFFEDWNPSPLGLFITVC